MSMYNLIEYNDYYLKISGMLCQFYADAPVVDANGAIVDFTEDNASTESFNLKVKLTGQTGDNSTKNVEIAVPLNFYKEFLENS